MSPLRDPTRRHPRLVRTRCGSSRPSPCSGSAPPRRRSRPGSSSQATAYRLLNNLVGEEYLVRTADLRGFGLGRRLGDLIGAVSLPRFGSASGAELDALRGSVRSRCTSSPSRPTRCGCSTPTPITRCAPNANSSGTCTRPPPASSRSRHAASGRGRCLRSRQAHAADHHEPRRPRGRTRRDTRLGPRGGA